MRKVLKSANECFFFSRDVRFTDLQSILEFIYLGEVNLEQTRLDSFLSTAEVLQIKVRIQCA